MDSKKYLRDLGLTPGRNYSPEEIKKAWKEKCQKHHPDKHEEGSKEWKKHQEEFVKATHAYKMLTDPSYRRKESLRKTSNPNLDLNIRMQVPISFEDAFFGTEFRVNYNQIELNEDNTPKVTEDHKVQSVTVTVPEGSVEGHEHCEPEKGIIKGEEVGNLILMFRPTSAGKFKIRGHDTVCEEEIPLDLMLKGGTTEVQTMFGLKTLKIPPGTKPKDELKIPKCGVKRKGHHVVVVSPKFPSKKDLQSDAWKGLDINWEIDQDKEDEEMEQHFHVLIKNGAHRIILDSEEEGGL